MDIPEDDCTTSSSVTTWLSGLAGRPHMGVKSHQSLEARQHGVITGYCVDIRQAQRPRQAPYDLEIDGP